MSRAPPDERERTRAEIHAKVIGFHCIEAGHPSVLWCPPALWDAEEERAPAEAHRLRWLDVLILMLAAYGAIAGVRDLVWLFVRIG